VEPEVPEEICETIKTENGRKIWDGSLWEVCQRWDERSQSDLDNIVGKFSRAIGQKRCRIERNIFGGSERKKNSKNE
jgi:hypothetical protein